MTSRRKAAVCLALQVLIIAGECLGTALSWGEHRARMFAYYTCDSNLLLLAAAAVEAVFCLRLLAGRGTRVPERVRLFRYAATCTTTMTFLVVLLVFAPLSGPGALPRLFLKGSLTYMHFLCPVLGLAAFFLAEDHPYLRLRHTLAAMIPTAAYAAVIVILNLARSVRGPYPFLLVYEQPVWASAVWAAVILGGAWLTAAALVLLKRRRRGRTAPPS